MFSCIYLSVAFFGFVSVPVFNALHLCCLSIGAVISLTLPLEVQFWLCRRPTANDCFGFHQY